MGTTGQSITLANSIIGVGILAMPFCFQQCGVLLATLILLLMGLVSRLCCYFLLKSALIARRRNFEFLAFHVFGSAGKLGVELGIIGFLMGTCIAYFVVVGDLGPQIISKMFNINQSDILRTSIMVIVSLVCVLPLGLLRNVDSLSNVSAATIGFYFCLVIKVISEAASQMLASDWDRRVVMWRPAGVLQCVPIFSMALFCQTQLFEIFESLPTLSLEKMNVVTKNAINICTAVYFTLGLFGYIAFCSHEISGNILMSLSPTMASDVIKLGFVMSVAFSFPLIIFPCRASLYSFLYKKVHLTHHDHIINHSIPETTFRCITVAIIGVALFISLLIPNIELVLGLVGSTIGVLICVVFPAACFVNVTFKNTNERVLAKAVLILGLVIMVLGTYANLQAAESRLDRYDDKITPERIDKIVEDFFQKMEKNGDFKAHIPNEIISHKEANKDEKDSEVQPPNPVPPESSNEKNSIGEKPNIDKKVKPDLPDVENVADKVSESHPKNVQNKLNGAKSNGKKLDENKIINKPVLEIEKSNLEQKTQDKIDMMKQQQLIETIKQHGMEQKELIKEQKEILNEIIKTKKELQQNKKDIGSEEAKKIAVESIQKIANRAIQSLINVSDKPAVIENGDKKSDPLEKIANEAVQDIAKKAAETIEAIEVKENLKEPVLPEIKQDIANIKVPMPNAQSSSNVNQVPVQNNAQINSETIQNVNPQANVNNINQANIPPVVQNVAPPVQTLKQNDLPINQIPSVNNVPPVQPAVNPNSQLQVPNYNIPNQPAQSRNQNIPPEQNQVKRDTVLSQDHSHSPDEPQSYKQGEDSQKKNDINKVPLPVAINSNSEIIGNSQVNGNSQINANPQVNGNSQINGVPQVNGNPQINANRPETDNFKIIANPQVNGNTQVNGNSQINSNPQVNEDLQGNGNSQINANTIVNGNSQINTNPQVNDNSQINENLKIDNNIKGDSKINKQVNQVPIVNTNKPDTIQSKEPVNKDMNLQNNLNIVQNNGAIKNIIDNNIVETQDNKLPIRQKREVIDCTEKHILKREDKKICDTLVSSGRGNEISEEVLPSKVDLNDAIKNHLPVGAMMHHMRSLKSYDATGKKR